MKVLIGLALPVVTIAVISGYYLNLPVPPVEQPWIYRTVMAINRVMGDMAWVHSRYHGSDLLGSIRAAQNGLVESVGPASDDQQGVTVSMETISGLRVRTWRADTSATRRPAVIYFHGGGWFSGTIYGYDVLSSTLAKETGAIVFVVEYRLSLESPSPAALNDCHEVTLEIIRNADRWGIDRTKVIVAGDSAGGNLAAALALRLRDEEFEYDLAGQIILYPVLQALDFHTPSYIMNAVYTSDLVSRQGVIDAILKYANLSSEYAEAMMENGHISAVTWDKYSDLISHTLLPKEKVPAGYRPVRQIAGKQWRDLEDALINPYNFPLMEEDLSDLPPAFILTMEHDPIRDDGLLYRRRLADAGNHVTHVNDARGWHAMFCFMSPPLEVTVANERAQQIVEFIKSTLAGSWSQ